MSETIYLDHAATTPMRPEVREAMRPYLEDGYGNPSSVHSRGTSARAALEDARARIAAAIGANRREIIFTGGGTEADNLAVLGRWRAVARKARDGERPLPRVVCSAIEHSAVLQAARQAAREGAPLVLLAVDGEGRVQLGALAEALEPDESGRPAVVSVMWVNNEVGTLQPVAEIARRCRECEVVFHSDAVQALGKVPVRVDDAGCDLLSMSGHKLGAPQGVGALYVRRGVELEPILHGGGQEEGLRSGTHNLAGAVGLATAVELATGEVEDEERRLRTLRDRLEAGLRERVPDMEINGGEASRAPQILNLLVPGIPAETALMALDLEGMCVSTGSACQSGSGGLSHVLVAMGRADGTSSQANEGGADGAGAPSVDAAFIRMSLGRTTTDRDIDAVLERFPRVVERVRSLS